MLRADQLRVAAALAGVLVLAAAAVLVWVSYQVHARPLAVTAEERIEVPRGAGLSRVARDLAVAGHLEHPWALRVHGRITGTGGRLRAGEYAIEPGMTAAELLERLVAGEVITYRFTLVEGWTFSQVRRALAGHEKLEHTLEGLSDAEVMAELGYEGEHPEGRFYPATYRFQRGSTDLEVLRQAYERMERRLAAKWQERAEDLPLDSPYEALILASIIERETGRDDERAKIAGVFARRLQRGMRLQTDPTVIYGLGEQGFEGRLRTRDLRTDTPYNTYTRHGLPPTPIAMPGSASLRAAVQPADGEYLYFVSRGDGSHHFSTSLEEHNAAVRRYILGEDS